MKLSDVVRDPDGKMSHFKLWNNVASATFTSIIISRELAERLSDDLLIWYAGMLITGTVISKSVSLVGMASGKNSDK